MNICIVQKCFCCLSLEIGRIVINLIYMVLNHSSFMKSCHSSMISTAACYCWDPGFKSQQGRELLILNKIKLLIWIWIITQTLAITIFIWWIRWHICHNMIVWWKKGICIGMAWVPFQKYFINWNGFKSFTTY